jgi:hypothetical protein
MQMRLTAKITGRALQPKVKNFRGLPPELTGGEDLREPMGIPVLIAIEQKTDGIFLFRFAFDGQVVGDTWHGSVEEAKQQAQFEFSDLLLDWRSVPEDVEDIVSFGLKPD